MCNFFKFLNIYENMCYLLVFPFGNKLLYKAGCPTLAYEMAADVYHVCLCVFDLPSHRNKITFLFYILTF